MIRRPRAAVAALALAVGCSSHGSIQTAHTVGEGNFQGAIEPGLIAVPNTVNLNGGSGTTVLPTVNFAGRYGVTDRFDLGGRFGSSLYEITAKFQFTDDDGTVVSLAPDATFAFFAVGGVGAGVFRTQFPLLIGIPTGDHQLVVGPNWVFATTAAGGGGGAAGGTAMGPGAQVAYSLKLSDGFRLHPELSVKFPGMIAVAAASGGGATASGAGSSTTPVIGFNVGLLFGGR